MTRGSDSLRGWMGGALLLAFSVVALGGCSDSPANGPDDSGTANVCPTPTGPGVEHSSTITVNETWAAADGPHVVTFGIDVAAGARLTIEPCSQVRLQPGYSIVVEGELVAEGTADRPITFVADEPGQPWGYLQVFAPGTMRLAYTTLDDAGGETTNSYAALEARGDQLLPLQGILRVDHVTVNRSAAYGVSLRAGAGFTADSRDLVITGSASAPLRLAPRLASSIPTGSYTGNALDRIVIATEAYGDVTLEDVTLHDRGVPYQVGDEFTQGRILVRGESAKVTLTLEPGVRLEFAADGRLEIDNGAGAAGAALSAQGTTAAPIVLTSAAPQPAPGDWAGIVLGGSPDGASRLQHVEVRYAGGPSQANSFHCEPDGGFSIDEDAAVSIYGEPSPTLITDSLIADSGRIGLNLAYDGAFVDLHPTNTFVNVPGCDVSWPRDPQGACPASSPCD